MMRLASAATAALLMAAAVVTACADSNEEPPASPGPSEESSLPPLDGGSTDAPVQPKDGSANGERICSADDWCHTEPPAEHQFLDLWGDGQGNLWAASILDPGGQHERGGIARFDGKIWSQHYENPSKLSAIWGSGPTDVWAGGVTGLLHGDGTTWTPVDLGEEGIQIEDITGSPTTGVWVVGTKLLAETSGARAFHRAPGAATWERVPIEGIDTDPNAEGFSEIRNVWITGNGDMWICARAGRDYLFRRRAAPGSIWTLVPTPAEPFQYTGVGSVAGDPWIFGYILFRGGAKYWTANGDTVDDVEDWTGARWKGLDRTSDQIRRFAVWGLAANDLWSGGSFAILQHWDGTSWTMARTSVDEIPIGDEIVAMWGKSNDDLWAVGGRTALHKVSKEEAARLEAEHAERAGKDGGQ